MTDFVTRPYVETDAAELAGLLNAIEKVADAGHAFSEAEVRTVMSAGVQEPASDTRLVFVAEGSLVAAAIVLAPPAGRNRARALGGVHPEWRGRELGRGLLAWQLERIGQIHRRHDPGTAWTIRAGASATDESALRLFRRFDLQPVRYFLEMSAPTTTTPTVQPPDGIHLVGFTSSMREALFEAHTDAFADVWGYEHKSMQDWLASTVDSDRFRADSSYVAMDGDKIAAYVLAYDAPDDSLYIGQVGTRRRCRKRGLASALLAATLTAGARHGKLKASLNVDADSPTGAVGVYENVGFTAAHSPYAAHEKTLESSGT